MDIQVLYQLQERLEAAAAAGIRLAGEDFRLKRAVDRIAPLAEASPVIKKLYLMALQTIAPDCQDRAGTLLDTLALSEAILCTQAGTDISGQLKPLELSERPLHPCQSYRSINLVLEALNGTGGGRYSILRDAMMNSPELFEDYRIQAAMISALSDRYNEIAYMAEEWLSKQDKSFIPLLKRDFWECSESSRVRRLRIICTIAEENENDFYISLLDKAKKELRIEVIYALRFHRSNCALLFDLLKTEKGIFLKTVRQILAFMDTEESDQYFADLLESEPWEAVQYLTFSRSDKLSACLGSLARSFFGQWDQSDSCNYSQYHKQWELLSDALTGMADSAVLSLYKRAADANWNKYSYYQLFPALLAKSIAYSLDDRLIQCAHSLAASHGTAWIPAALAADLLTQPASTVYEQYRDYFPKSSILGIGKTKKSRAAADLMAVLGQINYMEKSGRHEYFISMKVRGGKEYSTSIQIPLKENLDARWFEFFIHTALPFKDTAGCIGKTGVPEQLDFDHLLVKMAPPEVYPQLGKYLYDKALVRADNFQLYQPLTACGWTDFRGLVLRFVMKNPESGFSLWRIRQLLDQLPMTEEEKSQELREIDEFICTYPQKSTVRKSWDYNSTQRAMIDQAIMLSGGNNEK